MHVCIYVCINNSADRYSTLFLYLLISQIYTEAGGKFPEEHTKISAMIFLEMPTTSAKRDIIETDIEIQQCQYVQYNKVINIFMLWSLIDKMADIKILYYFV